jgi:hypothetical protein
MSFRQGVTVDYVDKTNPDKGTQFIFDKPNGRKLVLTIINNSYEISNYTDEDILIEYHCGVIGQILGGWGA